MRNIVAEHPGAVAICTGDVFDNGWKAHRVPPELINFAIDHLPKPCYAVPGQHDLPYHRLDDVHKSAYWTLVKAGVITDLEYDQYNEVGNGLILYGFPWGCDPKPLPTSASFRRGNEVHVAICHKYVWYAEHHYPGAPEDTHVNSVQHDLGGYDVAVFGDNHKGFVSNAPGLATVINGGTFVARRSDEYSYKPFVGLIYSDGTTATQELDTSKDEWADLEKASKVEKEQSCISASGFVKELAELGDKALNFGEAVRRFLESEEVTDSIRQMILDAMGE